MNKRFKQHQICFSPKNKFGAGFTLVELLVVMAMIGLLASITLVGLNSSKEKARDAVRMGDLKSLSKAVELYFTENNGVFPNNLSDISQYFTDSVLPSDPKSGNPPYSYSYDNNASPKFYCIGATMEVITDTGDACDLGGVATYSIKGP